MSSSIVINGRTVPLKQDLDTSKTNYIILRTTGSPLNKSQKTELQKLGVDIAEFVGDEKDQVYLCGFKPDSLEQVNNLDFVDYVGVYANEFAIPDTLKEDASTATVNVDVLLHSDVTDAQSPEEVISKIAEAANVDPSEVVLKDGATQLKVDADKLEKIAALDEVRVLHTTNERSLFNNKARVILHSDNAVAANKTPYAGNGQIVCVADTGLDNGSTQDVHEAFTGRVKELFALGRPKLSNDLAGHGTHVCGSVLGKGQHKSEGLIQGTAPAAQLVVQSVFSGFDRFNNPQLGGILANLVQLFAQGYNANARVHTNSWGSPLPDNKIQRPYDGMAENIDQFVWDNQDMTILFAAGNDGQDSDSNGIRDGKINERSLGAEAAAKNCITVGASENNRPTLASVFEGVPYTYGGYWSDEFTQNPLRDDHMANNPDGLAAFSSRGPTAEGRLKPDIVAPGTAILSTRSRSIRFVDDIKDYGDSGDDRYMYDAGTSMATPLVAGCCAVIREALLAKGYKDVENGIKNPTGSLIKALLINGATPIKGQYMPAEIGTDPNPHSGFGRVDVAASLPEFSSPFSGCGFGDIDEDFPVPFEIDVPVPETYERPNGSNDAGNNDGGWTFKVTLAYADLPGGQLQNDLNLVVAVGGLEAHGNQGQRQFDRGWTGDYDRNNNVEQVVWPSVSAHTVQLTVKPFRLMSSKVPFAYAWRFY